MVGSNWQVNSESKSRISKVQQSVVVGSRVIPHSIHDHGGVGEAPTNNSNAYSYVNRPDKLTHHQLHALKNSSIIGRLTPDNLNTTVLPTLELPSIQRKDRAGGGVDGLVINAKQQRIISYSPEKLDLSTHLGSRPDIR